MHSTKKKKRASFALGSKAHRRMTLPLIVLLILTISRLRRRNRQAGRRRRNTSALSGEAWVQEKLSGDRKRFQERALMPRSTFKRLVWIIETRGLLERSTTLSVSGKLMLLLYLLGQRASNRAIQDQFQIGAATVSLYVSEVLGALLAL